jgi:hypothetical protein
MDMLTNGRGGDGAAALRTFEQLTTVDAATRATFAGGGDIVAGLQQEIAGLTLAAGVPDIVAKRFDRCRSLFVYALFDYDFFTAAAEYAWLTEEVALRERIREKNPDAAPKDDGTKKNGKKKAKGKVPAGPWLDSSWATLAPLIEVASQEGVLTADAAHRFSLKHPEPDDEEVEAAQRQGYTIDTRSAAVTLRNVTAHGTGPRTLTPPMARDTLAILAGLINHLWQK